MSLHREKRKYRTKSGKVAYRSMMVAVQGQPQMRLRLKQGGPAKSGAPRKGAILGAVVGALGGAAVGAAGGAALAVAHTKKSFATPAWPRNPLSDPEFMSYHGGRVAAHLGGVATRGALVGTAAGSILGAVGALSAATRQVGL